MTSLQSKLDPRALLRTCRNALFDLRYGGFSGGYARNPVEGAHGTGATDYALMPQIFSGLIRPSDVLVDVGCGRGRVVNFWLSQGYRNRIYGLELMEHVAADTRRRLARYPNVTIITGNAIENLPMDGTVFYLFNPFDRRFIEPLADRLREIARAHEITIVYYAPLCLDCFGPERWKVDVHELDLPRSGYFEERHRRFAVITPRAEVRTYSSTQHTHCAGCGKDKHTPLRRDEMGGYVCLTCIDKRLDELDEANERLGQAEQAAEKWRILNQRRLIALEAVEWIMVNGRVQCPSCLHSQEEGHGVLCQLDEALRPTAEKLKLRAQQNALYAAAAEHVEEQAQALTGTSRQVTPSNANENEI